MWVLNWVQDEYSTNQKYRGKNWWKIGKVYIFINLFEKKLPLMNGLKLNKEWERNDSIRSIATNFQSKNESVLMNGFKFKKEIERYYYNLEFCYRKILLMNPIMFWMTNVHKTGVGMIRKFQTCQRLNLQT